ncbi:hypothetical protein CRI94_16955 [Longibacter salinarum]|uniref:DUF3667 domain-containing protein n=1 Tax=Longibacter salinarum TaxID=1850348 RepID=A0A2A8CTT8_9BACT|nr:DUF3667 domain-containing protein [Longibacter salinarum]PEN11109.1 hypothetical protein CRI94_16955 [Longibacter salinarum]
MQPSSYLRQGDIGRTTLLRVAYTLLSYTVGGGIMAVAILMISLDAMGIGMGSSILETLNENRPVELVRAFGWAHLALTAALGICVRTFHRRTLRSVLFGARVRGWLWASSLMAALGGVTGLWGIAWLVGHAGPLAMSSSVVLALLSTLVVAASMEGFRGYLLQSISARCSGWRLAGYPVGPWLAAFGAVLPVGAIVLAILLDADIPSPGAAILVYYVVGAGVLPALLMIADDRIERAVALHTAINASIAVAVIGGLEWISGWAVIATVTAIGGTAGLLYRSGVTSPRHLGAALKESFVRTSPVGLETRLEETGECRNCGTPLVGRYCHLCGQRHRNQEPSIRLLLQRFVDHVFEVDSRIQRTLRLLFFAPGALSAHYFAGRRADFIPPIRLYLVSSFAFFLLFTAFVPDWTNEADTETIEVQVRRSTLDSLYARHISVDTLLHRARFIGDAAEDSLPVADETDEDDVRERAAERLGESAPPALRDSLLVIDVRGDSLVLLEVEGLPESGVEAELIRRGKGSSDERVKLIVRQSTADSVAKGVLGPAFLVPQAIDIGPADDTLQSGGSARDASSAASQWERRLKPLEDSLVGEIAVERVLADTALVLTVTRSMLMASADRERGPSVTAETIMTNGEEAEGMDDTEALETLLQNAAKVMFVLVPAFALILSLIYLREPYAHHVIFSLHLHSFIFAVVSLEFALELLEIGSSILIPARIVIYGGVFVYLVAALRRAYGGGWVRVTMTAILVANLYFIVGTFVFGTAVGVLQNAESYLPSFLV